MPLILRQQKGSKLTIAEMDGNLEYLETSGYTKYVVAIPSSSILDPQNSPIEIIPDALTTNSFYIIDTISSYAEYEFNTTRYTSNQQQVSSGGLDIGYYDATDQSFYSMAVASATLLEFLSNGFAIFSPNPNLFSVPLSGSLPLAVKLPSVDLQNPGDGSLRVVVYAKQVAFGT